MTFSEIRLLISRTAIYASSLILIGCITTQPTQYYMLTSLDDARESAPSMPGSSGARIGLGPLNFPEYLDRPAIVLRSPGAEIIINDYHRWAESLDKNFLRVLSDNLQMLLGNTSVVMFPWHNSKDIDYQVIIQVARFDADLSNKIQLFAHWTIQRKSDGKILHTQKSTITQEADSNDFNTIVKTQSKVIGTLSHEIATGLQKIIQ
ncbi:hypothetical protein C8R34_10132 [Nitrosomonas sp. Nm84]|uniref:PqiC family protein n=1 Tax=Nitrosomonas sp. Nm84 TaxID=200124 RepID=UPI000D761C75|nr:PqiC family protein [Nitrosomonas sp. Nm84]PXW91123.1 hypothetical protein C8R34_10132 [Nitrosomonas sp. Nm84]